ncbi:MAG: hypothetical protein A2Z88_09190 [Omnitrophica WOR_2 bacterium GWA2_47_8]|nr:MAG: hypothetical protein A2Z88_09190 [Omnitrophica WOR_2 bacterium GWA2_47_8]
MQSLRRFVVLVSLSVVLFISTPSFAGLIGDAILLSHRFPSENNVVESYLVSVENGSADARGFGGLYLANPEDKQILFNFFGPFLFPPDPFNGHKVDFIDTKVKNVTVSTNIQGWDDSRLAFADHNARFNWAGLSGNSDSYLYATFEQDDTHVLPEPATLLLLLMGMPFFVVQRKRFQK